MSRFCTRISLVGVLLLLCFASGCSYLLAPGDPPARLNFAPTFGTTTAGNAKTRSLQVIVVRPSLPLELSGDAIILLVSQREMRRLAGYRWASTAPDMLERAFASALNQSGAFASAAPVTSGITSKYHILSSIDQFVLRVPQTADNTPAGPSVAIIQGTFRLVNNNEGRTLATLPIRVEQVAPGPGANDMADAMEKATVKVMEQVVPWAANILGKQK